MATSESNTDVTSASLVVSSSESDEEEHCDSIRSSSSCGSMPSILDVLRPAKLSELSRKRSVRSNPPKGKRSCTRGKCDPKSVSVSQHIAKHPNEGFVVGSNGKLFCTELSLKSSVLTKHIQSGKHVEGKKRLARKSSSEVAIALALNAHNSHNHLEGECLPVDQQVYRVKVVSALLKAGVSINKLSCFREILEENALRLTDRSHMANLIPFILEREKSKLKEEIGDRFVSACFDGTT